LSNSPIQPPDYLQSTLPLSLEEGRSRKKKPVPYRFCAQTHPGLHRDNNEDSVIYDEVIGLGVLADGMGGYNAGEVASGIATKFINSEMVRWLTEAGDLAGPREIHRAMQICIENANLAIFNAANSNAQYAGMGTTLVLGVFQGTDLLVGHIGDSRCYRWRQNQLAQLTKDHSLLQEQIDAGVITPEQAATSLNKNLVTRALGVDDSVVLEIKEHKIETGDLYLMCSDGLTDMVKDPDIAKILETGAPLEQLAQQLIDMANDHGGRDNITVLLIKAEAGPEKRGLMARFLGN
jgi:serine/threonine protein phosphatase PrpC